jgi:hypothetical protein
MKARVGAVVCVAALLMSWSVPVFADDEGTIYGTVVDQAGQSVGNAVVTITELVPNPPVDPYYEPVLGSTYSDGNGNWTLTVPSNQQLIEDAEANDNRLNVWISALFEDLPVAPTNPCQPLYEPAGSACTPVREIYQAVRAVAIEYDPGSSSFAASEPATLVVQQVATVAADAAAGNLPQGNQTPNPQPGPPPCTYKTTLITQEDDYQPVGEFHAWTDTTGKFTYGKTADSDVGVGVAYNGGSWSVSGSAHMGNSDEFAVSWNRGPSFGKQLKSGYHFVRERLMPDAGSSPSCSRTDRIRGTKWITGAVDGTDVSSWDGPSAYGNRCSGCGAVFGANTGADRNTGNSYTYTAGVQAFGVGLNIKSGFSSYVRIHWNFGSARTSHYLFGRDAAPNSAKIIYAA